MVTNILDNVPVLEPADAVTPETLIVGVEQINDNDEQFSHDNVLLFEYKDLEAVSLQTGPINWVATDIDDLGLLNDHVVSVLTETENDVYISDIVSETDSDLDTVISIHPLNSDGISSIIENS
jgi:hypothetical protein